MGVETALTQEASVIKHGTQSALLHHLLELLEQHRRAFRQGRSYWRVVGLALGELFNFGRHTVTQGLMALGLLPVAWHGRKTYP